MSYYAIADKDVYTGFHCGALSGLSANEREEAKRKGLHSYSWDRYTRLLDRMPDLDVHARGEKAVCKATLGSSLKDCLSSSTVSDLRDVASGARISLLHKNRKAEIVEVLDNELPKQVDRFDEVIANFGLQALSVVERLLAGEFVEVERYSRNDVMGSFPFAFLCKEENKPTWFMPQELREAFAKVNVHKYTKRMEMRATVARLLLTYTVLGGIVSVQEVLDAYRQSVPEDLYREEQAMQAVRELTRGFRSPFSRWEHEGVTYVALAACSVSTNNREYCEFTDGPSRNYRLESIWDEELYASLVLLHKQALPRAGMDDLFDKSVSEYVYGLPCVQSLVSYFDQHVPVGEREYAFADRMVDELICNFMFRRHTLLA